MIKNWKYYEAGDDIGNLKITNHQYMTGNILGIIAEKIAMKSTNGNMLNAHTYNFPVRIKIIDNYRDDNKREIEEQIILKIRELELEGCRCIISSGGRLGEFDDAFHSGELMAMSTPLIILDFVLTTISSGLPVCIVSDIAAKEITTVMRCIGLEETAINRCVVTEPVQKFYFSNNKKVEKPNRIGAYIWDSIEDYHSYLYDTNVPIYDFKKITDLLFNAVVQKPYWGMI